VRYVELIGPTTIEAKTQRRYLYCRQAPEISVIITVNRAT